MLFNEQSFIFVFLPVFLVGLLALRAWVPRLSIWWAILCSFFFYGFHAWEHIPLLAGSIALNYCLGLAIEKSKGNQRSLYLLVLGILCNLGVLALFKYADFLLGVLGTGQTLGLVLPLAI